MPAPSPPAPGADPQPRRAPMSPAQWFNVIALAIATTIAVNLGVVCLQYAVYRHTSAHMQQEWPAVLTSTLVFAAMTLIAGAAFLAQRRRWRARAILQLAHYAAVLAGAWLLYRLLT